MLVVLTMILLCHIKSHKDVMADKLTTVRVGPFLAECHLYIHILPLCFPYEGEPSRYAVSAVRLFSFIQGKPLLDLAPIPPVFFCKAGRHLGELQNALQVLS